MGKIDGFLLYNRKDNGTTPPLERITNFNEFHYPIQLEERKNKGHVVWIVVFLIVNLL